MPSQVNPTLPLFSAALNRCRVNKLKLKKIINFQNQAKYSALTDWGFNVAPVAVVWCLWSTLMSERYATML